MIANKPEQVKQSSFCCLFQCGQPKKRRRSKMRTVTMRVIPTSSLPTKVESFMYLKPRRLLKTNQIHSNNKVTFASKAILDKRL